MELLLTILGAFLGFAFGVVWAQVQGRYNRTQQRIAFRRQLASVFQFNLNRIQQMVGQLSSEPPIIPNYPFDTDPIKHILFSGREIVGSQEEFDNWNWHRYQLDHLNEKLIRVGHSSQEYQSFLLHLRSEDNSISKIVEELNAST